MKAWDITDEIERFRTSDRSITGSTKKSVIFVSIGKLTLNDRPCHAFHVECMSTLQDPWSAPSRATIYSGNEELVSIPDKKASTVVAHMVKHLFHRHGVTRQLVTDNGSEFINGLLQMVCDIMALEHQVFITREILAVTARSRNRWPLSKSKSPLTSRTPLWIRGTSSSAWLHSITIRRSTKQPRSPILYDLWTRGKHTRR
jgi:hypothetical protein